eukprot:101198_1
MSLSERDPLLPLLHNTNDTDTPSDIPAKPLGSNLDINLFCIHKLSVCGLITQSIFIFLLLYVIVAMPICYFYAPSDDVYIFLSVLIGTVIASIGGQCGSYYYGNLMEHIRALQNHNAQQVQNTKQLQQRRDKLQNAVRRINEKVIDLEYNLQELEETEKSFDGLREDLRTICGDNCSINDALQSFQNMSRDVHLMTLQHERAWLLSTYYSVCFKVKDDRGMCGTEYKHFMAQLPPKTRRIFERKFERSKAANPDVLITLREFENMIESFLQHEWIDKFNQYL